MASEWRSVNFADAVEINPPVKLKRGEIYPFVSMESVSPNRHWTSGKEFREYKGGGARFQTGDTLMARITPSLEHGKITRYRGGNGYSVGFGSTEFIVVREKRGVTNKDFVFYLVKSPLVHLYAISQMTGTSGRQRVPTASLRHLDVPIPPLPEQRAIAHILGTLDDQIETLRRMNETLEGIARALFEAWFVDFEPVRAKMSGRWRRDVGADGHPSSLPGLPADLYDLFPDKLVPSELGEIPEGWRIRKLGEVVKIFDSLRIPLSKRERGKRKGKYPYYGATSIMDYVDDYLFDGIYVLMGEDGSVIDGKGYPVLQYVWGKFWVNNHAHVLQGDGISSEHLLLFLQNTNIRPFVTGAVQPKLNQRNLKRIPFLWASHEINAKFSNVIVRFFESIRQNTEQSRTLAALRDTLLPELISGRLRVADAEKFLQERGL